MQGDRPIDAGNLPDISEKFTSSHNPNAAAGLAQTFRIERVMDTQTLEREWNPLLEQIFTDENDREPIELLTERFENGENFFLLRDDTGRAVGIELSQVILGQDENAERTGHKAIYVPWTGVIEEVRNLGIGPQFNQGVSDYMTERYGVTHTLIDIEDPDRLHDSGYAEEELPEAIDFAERRINFWRRQGFMVVDDETKGAGEKLEYCRPGSEDESMIQAYDHMCVRFSNDDVAADVLSEDGMQIQKSFVRECYVDMCAIQYDGMSEEDMRTEFPAIDKYLNDIDNTPGQWLNLRTSAVQPKTSPVANVQLVAGQSLDLDMDQDERYTNG